MGRFDDCLLRAVEAEANSRIQFYNKNLELLNKHAHTDGARSKARLAKLMEEIAEANKEIDRLNEESRKRQQAGDQKCSAVSPPLDVALFPELNDPRIFTHAMRPVPIEHLQVLYDSKLMTTD